MLNMTGTAIAQSRPLSRQRIFRLVGLALAASLFTAAAAQISVTLPFSPVPITGQTLAVLLIGSVLGARAGALAMVCYLGEGALGLPVFAAGSGGPAVLAGPTAGYLWAFPAAAFIAGALVDRLQGRYTTAPTLLALLLADALVFLGGVSWLSHFFNVDISHAATLGLWGYIPGDLVKVILVSIALPSGRALLNSFRWGTTQL